MIRLALAVLAGATIVAAQVPQGAMTGEKGGLDTTKHATMTMNHDGGEFAKDSTMKPPMDMAKDSAFEKRLGDAMQKCGTRADSARETSKFVRGEIAGKSAADSAKYMGERDSTKKEAIQGAIDAMERHSTRMATQVKDVQEKTQVRMTERRDELIQLQQKIQEKKAEKAAVPATTPAAE
jgi:hypothetical protein